MTRFARAKGSKASNERVPEEATPWSEMKQQLLEKNTETEENKKRKKLLDQRQVNYKAFLEEKEQNESNESKWAEFPGTKLTRKSKDVANEAKNVISMSKPKLKKTKISATDSTNNYVKVNNTESNADSKITKKGKRKKSNKSVDAITTSKSNKAVKDCTDNNTKGSVTIRKVKKPKSKELRTEEQQKSKKTLEKKDEKVSVINTNKSKKRKLSKPDEQLEKPSKFKKVEKNQIRGSTNNKPEIDDKMKSRKSNNLSAESLKKIEKKKQKRVAQLLKKKRFKEMNSEFDNQNQVSNSECNTSNNQISAFNKFNGNHHKNGVDKSSKTVKDRKFKNKKEHHRRKPLSEKMFINGKEIEIAYVDGFPVKKEDADRLKSLKKELISKGLPRSEIDITLKLERRRAEKAFAREKKKVSCFFT